MSYTGVWIQSHRIFILPFYRACCCSKNTFSGKDFDPRQKGKTCPFNAFLPLLPVDHLEDRRMAEFYHKERGKEKPASLKYPSSTPWRKSRDIMCCQLLGSTCLLPSCSQPLWKCEMGFQEQCPWGVKQQGWHSQDKMSRCMEQGHKHKKRERGKRRKRPVCACTQINKKCNASFLN